MGIRPLSDSVRMYLAVALLWSPGCRNADVAPAAPRTHPDVVLLTIDTLRADRIWVNGAPAGIAPAIDEIRRAGAIFLDATAHAPLTLPSHASILTGRYPIAHQVHDNGGFALATSVPTLATVLRGAGYHTAAFVSSFVLRGATGLANGFELYDDRFEGAGRVHLTTTSLERRAAEVARGAARWMKDAPRPFFLWVHFYDPHAPYNPPPAFAAKFPGRPYDGEVAAADFGVSTVLESLTAARRSETVVIVTGDHGESLGEHGESEHGILLYDSTLHVPLVMQGPGIAAGMTVSRQVRHVDLLPTIAALAGVGAPAAIDGVSLVPLLGSPDGHPTPIGRASEGQPMPVGSPSDASKVRAGSPAADQQVRNVAKSALEAPPSYAESRFGELHFGWSPIHSLRDGSWKYIDGPAPELYQLSADPGERDNRRGARADTASGMARFLDALASRGNAAGGSSGPDVAERLRTLGYVSGRVELGAAGADPKREIARYEAYVKAFNTSLAALETGRAPEAEAGFRRLAREFPLAFETHQYLARALAARRATADAVAELDLAIELSPREAVLYFDAARLLSDEGQFEPAFARIAEGRRLEPASFYGALTEGLVARAAGQTDRAERAFRDAIQMNPTLAVAHLELGQIAESRGDRDAARREYQLALDGDATLDGARRALERLSR
jgi:arylsulfatase A-like enzyme/Flp pilus assembly protein TadD